MCDTWAALRDVTLNQHVIFAKNSDRPVFDCQPLMFYPHKTWPAGSSIQLEYVEVPQVDVSYANIGSSPYWCWGYEEGINEHNVVIGNEAIFTKQFKISADAYRANRNAPPLGLLGMDLVRLALERSQTARQAVTVMGDLIEQYGQFGSGVPLQDHDEGGYDNSFIIADPQEAWVLEAVGERWVARQFTDGCYSISNELTITDRWDAGSEDVVDYAQAQGWWSPGRVQDFATRDEAHVAVFDFIEVFYNRQTTHS